MGKIAFVFPGQGAQYSGMGKELCAASEAAAEVFRLADSVRPGTSEQCFTGTEEELKETANTQPCMFAVELAAAAALRAAGVVPDAVAGFSLGEVAALTFSGAVSFEDGFRLVTARGELMQADAEKTETAMAAVLRLTDQQVEELCSQCEHVFPVNYNCPGQVSVSSLKEEMAEFSKTVKAAGGRAVPLRVKGGFHSIFMREAAEAFSKLLDSYQIGEPEMPLYSDYTGLPYAGDYRELLSKQICNPVRWQNIVTHMVDNGFDTFVEVGPGSTLSGLITKTAPQVKTCCVGDREGLEQALEELK